MPQLSGEDVDFVKDLATEVARAEAKAVLKAMVVLQARLAIDLIANNQLTQDQYIASLDSVMRDPSSAHASDPVIFDAVARAALTLFQQPLSTADEPSQ
jgi:hypothetical protein